MNIWLKNLAKTIVPVQYHFYLRRRRTAETYADYRKEMVCFWVDDRIRLDVYWKILNLGKGPSLILNIFGEEVLRFDFFGEGAGHYHVTVPEFKASAKSLLFLPEKTVSAQIDRAIFELTHNLDWYLHRHPLGKIRNLSVNKTKLQHVAAQAQAQLLAYIGKAEELEIAEVR